MVDPISIGAMATMSLGATAAGGITGAVGGLMKGSSESAMYGYQAGVAQLNAKIARQNAAYEVALGEQQAQTQGMKTRATISQTRANQGAGGLDVNSGSNVQVQSSEAELGSYDQALIRNNAARRAYGFEVKATEAEAQANLDTMAASTSRTAGYLDAFTSVLGSAASFGTKFSTLRGAGAI
jgi:hypothetical protein